jgi:2-isopropylmalate synthase
MKQTVWGVGIHEDVVQSSLLAMLSAASNVSFSFPFHEQQQKTFLMANHTL